VSQLSFPKKPMTKDQRSLTKLEKEKLIKKQEAEEEEYLDEITQEDEAKAAKTVIWNQQKLEKEEKQEKDEKLDKLQHARRWKKDYVYKLALFTCELIKQIDFPRGYVYRVGYSNEKMNIIITAPNKKRFGRGIKPVGIPRYDFHAIGILLTQCENTIDKLENRGVYHKGIILPQ